VRPYLEKFLHKKGLVEWLKVKPQHLHGVTYREAGNEDFWVGAIKYDASLRKGREYPRSGTEERIPEAALWTLHGGTAVLSGGTVVLGGKVSARSADTDEQTA
jgi:hypothetical protein